MREVFFLFPMHTAYQLVAVVHHVVVLYSKAWLKGSCRYLGHSLGFKVLRERLLEIR